MLSEHWNVILAAGSWGGLEDADSPEAVSKVAPSFHVLHCFIGQVEVENVAVVINPGPSPAITRSFASVVTSLPSCVSTVCILIFWCFFFVLVFWFIYILYYFLVQSGKQRVLLIVLMYMRVCAAMLTTPCLMFAVVIALLP